MGAELFKPLIYCPACGQEQLVTGFRRLRDAPLLYCDFCRGCETQYGVLKLYSEPNFAPIISLEARSLVREDGTYASQIEEEEQSALQVAEKEMARRELMRRRLIYYVTQFRPDYLAGWVHHDMARRLENFVRRVARKESPRLMMFLPPRTGKSTLVSDELPSWVLGHYPSWEIISASYAVSLPIGFSRRIRDRLDDKAYQAVFPKAKVRSDSRGVEEWLTTEGGRFRAAGVEGGITGTGCHILNIDDPIKDYQEAQSDVVRENAYNWYTTTARTRLAPGAGVLITQTRWHDGDLAGRLLSDHEALVEAGVPEDEIDQWEVVSYPALAEADEYLFPDGLIQVGPGEVPEGARLLRHEGDALHPERYSAKALRTIRNTMPSQQWNALYQQNPVPDDGEYFTSDMFRFYSAMPGTHDEYTFFSAWDLAIGLKTQNDWTVGVVGALGANGALYVVDMVRARMSTYPIVESMVSMGKKWPDMQVMGIEDGQIKKTLLPLLQVAMTDAKSTFSFDHELKPVTDKLLRARPLQQRMQMGQIYLPSGQPWAAKVQQELLRFPNGTHDDIVDALAWLARMALRLSPPASRIRRKKRATKSWRKELHKYTQTPPSDSFMTA